MCLFCVAFLLRGPIRRPGQIRFLTDCRLKGLSVSCRGVRETEGCVASPELYGAIRTTGGSIACNDSQPASVLSPFVLFSFLAAYQSLERTLEMDRRNDQQTLEDSTRRRVN